MACWRTLILCVALGASVARADEAEPARVPTARVSLTSGGALRQLSLAAPSDQYRDTSITGFSPFAFQLNAAWFPLAWLGADLDAAFTRFTAYVDMNDPRPPLLGGAVAPSVVGRWVPAPWLRLEGAVGYGLQADPLLRVSAADETSREAVSLLLHGPTAKVSVGVSLGRFDATAWARGLLGVGGVVAELPLRSGLGYELGLRGGAAVLDLDRARVTAVARVGLRGGRDASLATAVSLDVGLGFEVSLVPARPVPPPPQGTLRVEVRLAGDQPARGATVRVGVDEGPVDEAGVRRVAVPAGPLEVTARLSGFEAASQAVVAVASEETVVTLSLAPLTGPGSIRGRVQLEDGAPLAGVVVTSAAGDKVTSDAQGSFELPRAGPGVVGLTFVAPGYLKKEELVQVPPAAEAAVTVTLTPSTEPLKATLRGSIRSTTGKPVAAAVRIAGSKTKVKVSPDGRFEVQLEAGTWSLTISAPRHVTQTKSVTLAPGDQAIFQVDLQPGG